MYIYINNSIIEIEVRYLEISLACVYSKCFNLQLNILISNSEDGQRSSIDQLLEGFDFEGIIFKLRDPKSKGLTSDFSSSQIRTVILVRRQTSVMIVRCAEIILVDARGGEATVPRQRLSIRRRAGDRRERAGGRTEDRGRIGTGYRGRHAEGGLVVAGCAFAHGAVNRLARPRVLFAL